MTLDPLPSWARELIAAARVARLAFLDDRDRPRVLPLTFALAGEAIWSAVDEKPKRTPEPARVRYLRRRPQAALLVDLYSEDWEELAWVQVLGSVAVFEADGAPDALTALADKYPQYRERRPSGPLLRLDVERALCWRAQRD